MCSALYKECTYLKENIMNVKRIAAGCVAGMLSISLFACGNQQSTSSSSAEVKKEEAVEQKEQTTDARQVLGKQSAEAQEIALTNGLAGNVTQLSIRVTGQKDYGENLIAKDGKVAKGEEVRLFVEKQKDSKSTIDIKVKVDGKNDPVEFSAVPVTDIATVKLAEADGVAFVEYTDAKGAKGSTKDKALEAKKQADEKKAADQNAQNSNANSDSNNESNEDEGYVVTEAANDYASNDVSAAPAESSGDSTAAVEAAPAPEPEPAPAYEPEPAPAPEPEPAPAPAPEPAPAADAGAADQSGDACLGDVVLRN